MDSSFHELDDAKARALHLLTCPLCSTQYHDPRVLPCQHTFCCRCLVAHVDAVQTARSTPRPLGAFPCPQCHADVGLPAGGASAFPVDRRIANIRDLCVDEMAKDLASRIKDRRKAGGGVCNGDEAALHGSHHRGGHGGVGGSTRLSNINERSPGAGGVDDDAVVSDNVDFGTWPASARQRRSFDDQSTTTTSYTTSSTTDDPPAFTRHGRGYSSVRARRSRLHHYDTASRSHHEDAAWLESPTFSADSTTSPEDAPTSRFSRTSPGYYSMRVPRSRRSRPGGFSDDVEAHQFDATVLPEGRTPTSSLGSFANEHSSSSHHQTHQTSERFSSHAEDTYSKSSPFDRINRDDDDLSEAYTPIIGRHRLQYSSLRERRRRPYFDPTQLYDGPADFTKDEDLSGSDGSGRFIGVGHHGHHAAGVPSSPSSEFAGNLRRTVSSDLNNWTQHSFTSHEPHGLASRRNREYGSDQVRPGGHECTSGAENGTTEQPRRQRSESFDTSVLTLLSNLPADVRARITNLSKVSDSTDNHRQSETRHADAQPSADAVHRTAPSESMTTSSTVNEVTSASHTDVDVTSWINEPCQVNFDETADEVMSSKQTEPTDIGSGECLPASSVSAAEQTDAVHHASDASPVVCRQCSMSEEGICSSPRSPNESCFSRLTKFRSSKNSRQAAASSASSDTTSQQSESPSHGSAAESNTTVPASKARVRKRPSAFVGTAFSFPVPVSGGEENAATSPPPIVSDDDEESAESSKEQQSNRNRVSSENNSTDVDEVKTSQTLATDRHTNSFAVPPEMPPASPSSSVETDDVKSSAVSDVDVSVSQSTTAADAQSHEEDDSAVYSAASVDTDVSPTSVIEQPTPSTDNDFDADDVLTTGAGTTIYSIFS